MSLYKSEPYLTALPLIRPLSAQQSSSSLAALYYTAYY
jgi:hypothetical protein